MAQITFDNPSKRVEDLMIKAYRQMRPFIVSAHVNVEYIRGNQNIRVDKNLNIKKIEQANKIYMERKIFNRMSSIYLSRLGLLSANMPLVGFKQDGSTPGRFIDYTEGNMFVQDLRKDIQFKSKVHNKISAIGDMHGLVWVKTGIDWTAGKKIGTYDVKISKDGEPEKKLKQTFYEGRPWVEVCPMDEVFADNYYEEDEDNITELVHRRLFTLDYIKRRWGIEAKEDLFDNKAGIAPTLSPNDPRRTYTMNNKKELRYAFVYEYYHRANAEYPNGVYFVLINNQLVTDILPLPYENGKNGSRHIPFNAVRLMTIPNYLIGPTVYNQIVPVQDTYNSVKNRVLEYINRIGVSQVYAWENSLVDKKQLSNRPGEIFMLRRNSKPPQPVVQDKLGTEFLNYLMTLERDMTDIAGLSQLTAYGMAKSGMRTDGVVDKISESDQNKLEHAVDNIGEAYVKIFKKLIYIEMMRERILTQELQLAKIDDYIMKYKIEAVDVEQLDVTNRDFLMKDDQYINAKFQQATSIGVYNPQSGLTYVQKVAIMERLALGSILNTLDPVEVETNQIVREEHEEIEQGLEPEVEKFHVHEQHIYEHYLYMQSPVMRKLRKYNKDKYDKVKDALMKHIQEHEKFTQDKQNSFGHMMKNYDQNQNQNFKK